MSRTQIYAQQEKRKQLKKKSPSSSKKKKIKDKDKDKDKKALNTDKPVQVLRRERVGLSFTPSFFFFLFSPSIPFPPPDFVCLFCFFSSYQLNNHLSLLNNGRKERKEKKKKKPEKEGGTSKGGGNFFLLQKQKKRIKKERIVSPSLNTLHTFKQV